MNEVIETILKRTGTTEYRPEQISDQELNVILKCGVAAPNAFNAQMRHFTAVQNEEILETIDRRTFDALDALGDIGEDERNYRPLYGAPTLVLISADRKSDFGKQDCSCANENMAIAAKSLGIGSRYLDVPNMAFEGYQGEKLKALCKIPEGYDVICSLSLGYPIDPDEKAKEKDFNIISLIK